MSKELIDRIIELEIKVSFQDDFLERLDRVIISQQKQIDLLQTQLRFLHQAYTTSGDDKEKESYSLFDELPPHY